MRLFNRRTLRIPSYWAIAALPLAGLPLATAAGAGPLDDVKEMTRELTGQGGPDRDRNRGPNRDRDGRDRDVRDGNDRDQNAQRDNDRDQDRDRNARRDRDEDRERNAGRGDARDDDRNRNARGGDDRDQNRNANRDDRVKRDTRRAERGNMDEIKKQRRQRSEDGGKRTVIEEPGNRIIVKERGGRATITHDETDRFRRGRGDVQTKKRDGGGRLTIAVRPGGIKIYSEYDDKGRLERRYRKRNGRETTLIDNRKARRHRRDRDGRAGFYVDLRPPQVRIPRRQYIVEYEDASESEVYDALMAPPVDDLERSYTLEEVRYNRNLRDRMRRIDLDTINFEFGSWQVERDQYRKLERVARAINRILDRRPDEMFFVEGHTDAVGSDIDNLTLSDRRAEEVAIILSETFDVPPENLITQGYGEEFLKIETERAERANRRVAVRRITPLIASR